MWSCPTLNAPRAAQKWLPVRATPHLCVLHMSRLMLSSTLIDELSYVRKDQLETSALFELIAHRYERHSIAITANEPFSGWSDAMTVAAIDRLVHHSTIIEMNGESYRKRAAVARGASTQNANDEPEDPPNRSS
ncbi:transposase [Mesorhizobium japonicum MAFF 303099]|uniref:Transposase n=1 Tax=Mesorhizobium japonicum (strain LMG 29417 / CECT 9101 / MAFF 303099) TaxID=266835 RepID=Q989Z1_RHILO|nr:transposase [Mesorhizobium japonicum MAFF 303099]